MKLARLGWLTFALVAVGVAPPGTNLTRPTDMMVKSVTSNKVRTFFPLQQHASLILPNGERRSVRSLLKISRRMRFGEYVWNDDGVPSGLSWIRVDLARQTLSVFRAGHEIGSAVVLYGTDGKPTPIGIFSILERAKEHRSTLYDAEMPYMLKLTSDGVAIHASDVRIGSASHGCIGIPLPFARLLYDESRKGSQVVILPAVDAPSHSL